MVETSGEVVVERRMRPWTEPRERRVRRIPVVTDRRRNAAWRGMVSGRSSDPLARVGSERRVLPQDDPRTRRDLVEELRGLYGGE